MNNPLVIDVPVWVKRGSMMIRRDSLEYNDPDHTYNWFTTKYPNLNPLDYGLVHPLHDRFKELSREQLIQRIIELEEILSNPLM